VAQVAVCCEVNTPSSNPILTL